MKFFQFKYSWCFTKKSWIHFELLFIWYYSKSCLCRLKSPEVVCPRPLLLKVFSSLTKLYYQITIDPLWIWWFLEKHFECATTFLPQMTLPHVRSLRISIIVLNYWGKEWTGWWVLVVQSFTYRSLRPWSEVTFAHNSFKISDFVPTVSVAI